MSISGFSDKYYFLGFLPEKEKEINEQLNILSNINCSIVFFISAKKINKVIKTLVFFFPDREIVICREISKIYEEFIRKNVDDLEIFNKELKGELTIVISEKKIDKNHSQELSESDMNIIKKMINKLTIKEITGVISQNKDISKKEIYNYCLKIKNEI